MQYYTHIPKTRRKKYKVNKIRLVLTFFLIVLLSLLLLVVIKYKKIDPQNNSIYSNVDIITPEEIHGAKDILDIDFEETNPQELTLHIPESEIKVLEKNEKQVEKTGNYIVKRGDSLWSIAHKYGISVYNLSKINGLSPSRVLKVGQILNINPQLIKKENNVPENKVYDSKEKDDIYKVKRGDSLWLIAQRYGVYVSTLQYLNNLKSSNLKVGQSLKVSTNNTRLFKVSWKTTLANLANYFNCSSDELKKLNPSIKKSDLIKLGTEVTIPNKNPYFVNNTQTKYFENYMGFWPVNGNIASPYGWRKHPVYGKKIFHNGIDIENDKGTPVKSIGPGKVIFASYKGNSGKLVIIQHKSGLQTIYAHLDSILTKKGKKVGQGDVIGKVGNTGVSTGPHLHFGIRKNGKFINPVNYLN